MYHFLFVLTGKIFRSFNKEKNIDSEKEQIIDFCPQCNEQLADKKVITLINHQKQFHPKTEKELVSDYYRKGNVQFYTIIILIAIVSLVVIISAEINSYFYYEGLSIAEIKAYEFCKDLKENFPDLDIFGDVKQSRIDRSEYVLANIDAFEKCNYSLTFTSFGNTEERIDNFLSIDD